MKLSNASYCPDCGEVFPFMAGGACPSCTNKAIVSMTYLLLKKGGLGKEQSGGRVCRFLVADGGCCHPETERGPVTEAMCRNCEHYFFS